jgi:hypothetical protein
MRRLLAKKSASSGANAVLHAGASVARRCCAQSSAEVIVEENAPGTESAGSLSSSSSSSSSSSLCDMLVFGPTRLLKQGSHVHTDAERKLALTRCLRLLLTVQAHRALYKLSQANIMNPSHFACRVDTLYPHFLSVFLGSQRQVSLSSGCAFILACFRSFNVSR